MRELIRGVIVTLTAVVLLAGCLVLIAGVGFWRLTSNGAHEPEHAMGAKAPVRSGAATEAAAVADASGNRAMPPKPISAAPAPLADKQTRASLIRVDNESAGGWVGRYGKQGYRLAMPGDPSSLPPSVLMKMAGAQPYTWSAVTTDRRGLSLPANPQRLSAGQWFSWDQFSIDLDLRGRGEPLQVALYLLDWDSDARAQRLAVTDAESGAPLLSRDDEHFNKGRYLLLRISGHVKMRFTKINGANCTLSGVFLDDVPALMR